MWNGLNVELLTRASPSIGTTINLITRHVRREPGQFILMDGADEEFAFTVSFHFYTDSLWIGKLTRTI